MMTGRKYSTGIARTLAVPMEEWQEVSDCDFQDLVRLVKLGGGVPAKEIQVCKKRVKIEEGEETSNAHCQDFMDESSEASAGKDHISIKQEEVASASECQNLLVQMNLESLRACAKDVQITLDQVKMREGAQTRNEHASPARLNLREGEHASYTYDLSSVVQVKIGEGEEIEVFDRQYSLVEMKVLENGASLPCDPQNISSQVKFQTEAAFGLQDVMGFVMIEQEKEPFIKDDYDPVQVKIEPEEPPSVMYVHNPVGQMNVGKGGGSPTGDIYDPICRAELEEEGRPDWNFEEYAVYVDIDEGKAPFDSDHSYGTTQVVSSSVCNSLELSQSENTSTGKETYSNEANAYGRMEVQDMSSMKVEQEAQPDEDGPYVCVECGLSFAQELNLHLHQARHSGEDHDADTEDEQKFAEDQPPGCNLAQHHNQHTEELGRRSEPVPQLAQPDGKHMGEETAHNIERGDLCMQEKVLIKHLRTHLNEKWHKCNECGQSFRTQALMTRHLQKHIKEKLFICPVCGKGFTGYAQLTAHEKTHEDDPFLCRECGQSFSDVSSFLAHHKMHPRVKPYACTECDKCFSSPAALSSHQQMHAKRKVHTCTTCAKGFNTASQLSKHQKLHKNKK
ncbi:zinc finger protein 16-like [Ambystoma mexicanum]|uniref:zinc finger protein 16-like n=1 Tax=Ambystoma mexicanum TaxID=8296 RepID=UPI0037E76DA7